MLETYFASFAVMLASIEKVQGIGHLPEITTQKGSFDRLSQFVVIQK
jgi:hypothetical protein